MISKKIRSMTVVCILLTISLAAQAGPNEVPNAAKPATALRLLIAEVQPGAMASEQYCLLVFADRHFHSEKATRKSGGDQNRKVYEGELSEGDWSALGGIIDSADFRKLNVSPTATPPVIQDAHIYSISVARENTFQNMEFMDDKSRKPYEAQLKPLLQWWKSVRGRRMAETGAHPDSRCSTGGPMFSY
jgi:hypothetical protein